MAAASLGMTAEELVGYEVPGKRVELVRGQLVLREPPSFVHGSLTLRLAVALSTYLARDREAHGWAKTRGRLAMADPGFTLARRPDTVRAPDIAYVSRDRFAVPMPDGYLELAPDLAVEVRSPTDRTGAVVAKVGDFLTAGTQLVWVVDPRRKQVVVYAADGGVYVLTADDMLTGGALLPGFAMSLEELFAED